MKRKLFVGLVLCAVGAGAWGVASLVGESPEPASATPVSTVATTPVPDTRPAPPSELEVTLDRLRREREARRNAFAATVGFAGVSAAEYRPPVVMPLPPYVANGWATPAGVHDATQLGGSNRPRPQPSTLRPFWLRHRTFR